jgi:hypothetical protein
MPTVENAIRYGHLGRLNAYDKAVFKAMNTHQDYIWSLICEHLEELQNFAEEVFHVNPTLDGAGSFDTKQLRASVHKLHNKKLIGRVRIGATPNAKRPYPGRWHYGSLEACELVEEQLRLEHRTQVCMRCQTPYTPNRSDQKYCCQKCRSATSSEKHYAKKQNEQYVRNTLYNTA